MRLICTSNRYVIQVSLEFGKKHDIHILIKSTSKQVNPFCGYTGIKPAYFFTLAIKNHENRWFR
ncbi:hypothetical protein CI105_06900 [Candidatus Izimaplasma bacterium ZiA1]|nr:hypothetical protein CI105_06900 [Candidatus Izimaplasma bacterium ZiA1]